MKFLLPIRPGRTTTPDARRYWGKVLRSLKEATGWNGATGARRTHPMVVIGGVFQQIPFYVQPDNVLRYIRERQALAKSCSPAARYPAPVSASIAPVQEVVARSAVRTTPEVSAV